MRKISITSSFIYLISLLPFPVLYFISDVMYLVLYHVAGYRRKVVSENLANAFPEKSVAERKEIEKKFYRFLPDLIVETVKMRSLSRKDLKKRFRFTNPELIVQYMGEGKQVVCVTAHYANWEMGIHGLNMISDDPVLIVYKPLADADFNLIFNKIRARFGAVMVPMKQTLRYIVRYKDVPHLSVFVSDQTPRYEESDYFIQFLNQPTLVFTGAARIAKRLDGPVIYCHVDRVKRGYYQTTFHVLTDRPNDFSVNELTDLYNRFTEDIIKNKPELWLWSHRRWKRKPLEKHLVSLQSPS